MEGDVRVRCPTCSLAPCACAYTKALRAGDAEAFAQAYWMMRQPEPHQLQCPCPKCWSARQPHWRGSWYEDRAHPGHQTPKELAARMVQVMSQ